MKFEKRKILIVDDDKGFLELVKNYFVSHQYEVVCADGPPKAIQAMREGRFKVIILDYQMPQVNGDELIAMLQKINPTARFIVVTGILSGHVEERFKGLGYFAFLEKGQLGLKTLEEAVLQAFSS